MPMSSDRPSKNDVIEAMAEAMWSGTLAVLADAEAWTNVGPGLKSFYRLKAEQAYSALPAMWIGEEVT